MCAREPALIKCLLSAVSGQCRLMICASASSSRQAHVAGAKRLDVGVGEGVISQQRAAEAGHDLGEGRAYLPGADHADGFADQIETGQPMQAEIAIACAVIGAVQAPVEREDQRHRVFGHGVRRIGRYANDGQPQTLGGWQVDMVVTRRAQGDQAGATLGQEFQHRRAEVIVDKRADHFVVFGQRHGVEVEAGGLELQCDAWGQWFAEETLAVVGLAAEKNDAH